VYILPSMPKALQGLFCYSNCIHQCPDQRCAWTGFRIFWIRTPAASNKIRSEVIFPVAGSGWIWILFLLRKRYWFFAWHIFSRTETWVGLLESSCYGIRIGFGFTICKTGLVPDSKKSESEQL